MVAGLRPQYAPIQPLQPARPAPSHRYRLTLGSANLIWGADQRVWERDHSEILIKGATKRMNIATDRRE